MAEEPVKTVILTDAEDKEFSVPIAVLKQSGSTLQTMIDDLGGDDSGMPLMVPNISDPVVWEKAVEYMTYMCEKEYPTDQRVGDGKKVAEFTDREKQFLATIEVPTLFNLIKAANFLDCKPLLEVTCKAVAEKIKGKTPEEIRQVFGIKKDFTQEEEEQVAKENAWMNNETDESAPPATEETD